MSSEIVYQYKKLSNFYLARVSDSIHKYMYCKKSCSFISMGANHNYRAFLCARCDYRFNPLRWTIYKRSSYDVRVWFYILWHRNSEINLTRILGLSKKLNRKDGGGVNNLAPIRRMIKLVKPLTDWQISQYLGDLVDLFSADYYEDFCLIDFNNEFVPKIDINKLLFPTKAFLKERLALDNISLIADEYAIGYLRSRLWDVMDSELEVFMTDLLNIMYNDKMITELEYKVLTSRVAYIMRLVVNRINPFPDLLSREIEPGSFATNEPESKEGAEPLYSEECVTRESD